MTAVLERRESEILNRWLELQEASLRRGAALPQDAPVQSREFLRALRAAAQKGSGDDTTGPEWNAVRQMLIEVSAKRAKSGFTPSETASFVFSLKEPIFLVLREEAGTDVNELWSATWVATKLLDKLGLFTTEALFQKTCEEVINRQQQELLELSTPVVRLWDNVLALPLNWYAG